MGNLTVTNAVAILGHRVAVHGWATPNPNHAGEFQVVLGPPGPGPKSAVAYKEANFLVIGLGPVVDGKYDFAIVTDPTLLSLYVLTRNVTRFQEKHDADVLKMLKDFGFTNFLNKPLKTQQKNCAYSEELVV